MRASTSTWVLTLLCALAADGMAQQGRAGAAGQMSARPSPIHGMDTVRPDSARTATQPSPAIRIEREQPRAVESRHPALESTVTPLRRDEPLNVVRPAEIPGIDARIVATPGAAALASSVFKTSQDELASLRTTVQGSQGAMRFSPQDHAQLQVATDRLERANAVFDASATTMSTRQQALAAIQIEAGTAQIRSATVAASADSAAAVQAGASLAADADSFARALPSGPRKLKVVVRPSPSGRNAEPMAVYVLPLGLVRYGPSTEESKLRNLIDVLAFAQPTSPALGDVEPGLKYAVWVGPRHSVELMARLIKNGAVQKYVPVDATAAQLPDVVFEEADQVRAP